MISIKQKGDFIKIDDCLKNIKSPLDHDILIKYANLSLESLKIATPKKTGITANSWSYKIQENDKRTEILFYNSNINKGVPIAVILQYGHGTGTGGWVEGVDYINPAVKDIFENLCEDLWKEVMSK